MWDVASALGGWKQLADYMHVCRIQAAPAIPGRGHILAPKKTAQTTQVRAT
jgi:hypothetical protein